MTKKTTPKPPKSEKQAFLAAYAETGSVTESASAAGVSRSRHYEWLLEPEYKAAFEDAGRQYGEWLEAEARRRAVQGREEPVVYQGQLQFVPILDAKGEVLRDKKGNPLVKPLTVPKVSDTLLIFLMKGHNPEKYRDNAKVEHTGPGGAPLEVTVKFVSPEK